MQSAVATCRLRLASALTAFIVCTGTPAGCTVTRAATVNAAAASTVSAAHSIHGRGHLVSDEGTRLHRERSTVAQRAMAALPGSGLDSPDLERIPVHPLATDALERLRPLWPQVTSQR